MLLAHADDASICPSIASVGTVDGTPGGGAAGEKTGRRCGALAAGNGSHVRNAESGVGFGAVGVGAASAATGSFFLKKGIFIRNLLTLGRDAGIVARERKCALCLTTTSTACASTWRKRKPLGRMSAICAAHYHLVRNPQVRTIGKNSLTTALNGRKINTRNDGCAICNYDARPVWDLRRGKL